MGGWTHDASVIITTRNRASFLGDALRSALSQVDISYEVRVVDDGSTDETPEMLARCRDRRVKVIRCERPCGVAAARNRAAAEAEGEWLAFLDDDDLWEPTWLRCALSIGRASGAGTVYGSRWLIDARRRVTGAMLAEHPDDVRRILSWQNALGGPSAVIVRADVLAAAGGFDERLSALADWDVWLRALDIAPAVPVPELLTAYTVHPGNMHVRDPFGVLTEFHRFKNLVNVRSGSVKIHRDDVFTRWLAVGAGDAGCRGAAARLWLRTALATRSPFDGLRAPRALLRRGPRKAPVYAAPAWLAAFSR